MVFRVFEKPSVKSLNLYLLILKYFFDAKNDFFFLFLVYYVLVMQK